MIEKIEDYTKIVNRFHMPGHSGADIGNALYNVAKYDITELDFSDNLQNPTGELREVEEKIAKIYCAKRSLMLTQGATAGIQTALLVAREEKGELYVFGETHKSMVSFASIIGLRIIFLDSMDEAISRVSEGDWIYVTSPNYYGMVVDIENLLLARAKGGAIIVDEAHGAHFVFSRLLPSHVMADFVVESFHKTLPVFTGGAVLNVNNEKYVQIAEYFKNKIHSTSPSYLIMSSIDYAMNIMSNDGEKLYAKVLEDVRAFRVSFDSRYEVLDTDDFTRVVIRCKNADKVAKYLESVGTYIELFDRERLVLIVTPWNSDRLLSVSNALCHYKEDETIHKIVDDDTIDFHLDRAKTYSGALKFLPLCEAEGYVSMSEIAIYPPGVPIVRTGDILTLEVLNYVKDNKDRIVGLLGDTIAVREVCEEN